MANVEVMVGPDFDARVVEATPFLPGLVIHKTPDSPAPHDLYNITHRVSGLAVLTHVHEQDLAAVRRMLGDVCWTIMPEDIFADRDYYLLIRMVLASIRGRDVLQNRNDRDRRRNDPDNNWGFFEQVVTPSFLTETISGSEAVVIEESFLAGLVGKAGAKNRTPALLVHLDGKEELAVVPYECFPKGFFLELKLTRMDATLKGRVVLDDRFAERSVRGHCLLISFGKTKYVALGYLAFLGLVKRGLS